MVHTLSCLDAFAAAGAASDEVAPSGVHWTDWLPIAISGAALLFSIFFGLSNRRISKRADRRSEQEAARRQPQLDLYLNDCAVWRDEERAGREYRINVLAVNSTDLPSAVVTADLQIVYAVNDHLSTVKVPNEAQPTRTADLEPIELPRRLEANDAWSGWLTFRVPDALAPRDAIERYDLVVRDIHETIATVQVPMFREMNS